MSRPIYHSAVQCVIKNDDNILLLKRQNTKYGNNKYALPGGHLEYNESIPEGMIRELYEEIGLKVKEPNIDLYKVIKMMDSKSVQTEYINFIFIYQYKNEPLINKEPQFCSELKWFNIKELPKNILGFIPSIFETDDTLLQYIVNEEE